MTDDQTPTCPNRPACDGCPSFEASPAEILAARRARVVSAVDDYPERGWQVDETVPAAARLGYRNRARMVVVSDATSAESLLGFYQAGTREVLPVESCPVHHPAIERALAALRPALFARPQLRGTARFVDVRVDRPGEQAIVTLALVVAGGELTEALTDALRRVHSEVAATLAVEGSLELGLHANVSGAETAAILSGRQIPVAGPEAVKIAVSGGRFEVPPQAFFQAHPAVLEAIHDRIRPWIADAAVVADLYAGVGVHGIACAPEGARLVGFDANPEAIEAAARNAADSGKFGEDGAAFATLSDAEAGEWLAPRLDAPTAVIINPARAGISVELVEALSQARLGSSIERIAYVSCEPRTLARDMDRLGDLGFCVASITPFDLMPGTDHVEVLVLLERSGGEGSRGELQGVRDFWPTGERPYDAGVSGPAADPTAGRSTWVARVVGRPPKGTPPFASHRGLMQVERLRSLGEHTVVRVTTEGASDRDVRERLRRWGYPVLGDEGFGDRNANAIARSERFLDRIALHCVQVRFEGGQKTAFAPVPGQLMAVLQLPRKVLQGG